MIIIIINNILDYLYDYIYNNFHYDILSIYQTKIIQYIIKIHYPIYTLFYYDYLF